MRENLSTRKCHMGLDAAKFSSAKISTFIVFKIHTYLLSGISAFDSITLEYGI